MTASRFGAGASVETLGEAACCAVKRTHLDERMARCAARSGAELREEFEVVEASFDAESGLWTVVSSEVSSFVGDLSGCVTRIWAQCS